MTARRYDGALSGRLAELQERVVACHTCERLVEYRERIGQTKRRKYMDWEYWAAPVPGFGDPQGRLLIVGLAPASHGANRTGRMFTGDATADFLIAALHRAGFATQPTSHHRGDGLELIDAYETAVVRCVPPQDKPTAAEQHACRPYLLEEIGLLSKLQAVLVLGRLAFDNYLRAQSERLGSRLRHAFKHGQRYDLGPGLPVLFASYHPSPRNTNTGRLTSAALDKVLSAIRQWLGSGGVQTSEV
jgi:uracil-DNA glycosylase